jgi:hypothetical protein
MSLQKNDLYCMTVCVLSNWKESYPNDTFSIVLNYGENEHIVHVFEHEDDWVGVILEVLGQHEEAENIAVYISKTPPEIFVNACKHRSVEKIVFMPTEKSNKTYEGILLIPFVFSFGKIIDVLSQYKPKIF